MNSKTLLSPFPLCKEAGGENIVVPPGTYVKVAGHLRSFQVRSYITPQVIRQEQWLEGLVDLTKC